MLTKYMYIYIIHFNFSFLSHRFCVIDGRNSMQCLSVVYKIRFNSVQFGRSVMSNSLRPHELQYARPPYPSPTPGVHPNSYIDSVMSTNHLILSFPSPSALNLSQHQGLFK